MMRLQVASPVIPTRPPDSVPSTAPNRSLLFLKGETYFPSGVTSPCLFIKCTLGTRTLFKIKYLQIKIQYYTLSHTNRLTKQKKKIFITSQNDLFSVTLKLLELNR